MESIGDVPARVDEMLEGIVWTDLQDVYSKGSRALALIANTDGCVMSLLRTVKSSSKLRQLAEKDGNGQIQVVLLEAPDARYRLRLHIMPEGLYDYPHGHRYPFVSYIMNGSLGQTIFDHIDLGIEEITAANRPAGLFQLKCGDTYALNHVMVHKVAVIDAPVVTLFLRGPAMKFQASNYDWMIGEHRWQRSASSGASEGHHKALGEDDFAWVESTLKDLQPRA